MSERDHALGITMLLDLPPEMVDDLRALAKSTRGRYGRSAEEVAERLIAQAMLELQRAGVLP